MLQSFFIITEKKITDLICFMETIAYLESDNNGG